MGTQLPQLHVTRGLLRRWGSALAVTCGALLRIFASSPEQ
jgi:hypothetical protein